MDSAQSEVLTLGSLVRPVSGHSLKSVGASIHETFAFSMNGSLMIFTVKPFVALMLPAVSFGPPSGRAEHETEIIGGLCVTYVSRGQTLRRQSRQYTHTWLNQLQEMDRLSNDDRLKLRNYCYLNGARFSTPSSDTLDTNAIGRGTIPLIMSAYCTTATLHS